MPAAPRKTWAVAIPEPVPWRSRWPAHAAAQGGDLAALAGSWASLAHPDALDDEDHWSCLHYASFYGHVDIVEHVLAHGASVDVRDVQGRSPLHLAAGAGHATTVAALLHAAPDRATYLALINQDRQTAADVCRTIHGPGAADVLAILAASSR